MSKIDPQIALVITDQETNAQIKSLGVGLLELRVDLFKKLDPAYIIDQIKHRKLVKIPLLLTLRNQKKEGAVKIFSDTLKLQIITAALPLVDMVDIELSSSLLKQVIVLARKSKVRVIVSSHYLDGMPQNLETIFKKALRTRADIVKIAAKANHFDDDEFYSSPSQASFDHHIARAFGCDIPFDTASGGKHVHLHLSQ